MSENPLKLLLAKKQASQPAATPAPAAAAPAAPAPTAKPSLNFLKNQKPAAPPAPAPAPAPAVVDLDSLDALAGFDATEVKTSSKDSLTGQSLMEGETPATAPTRELPADLDEQQQQFVGSLDSLYGLLFDAEMFGQVTKNIMIELQNNPQYVKLIADEDVNIIVRGMRESMGLARIKKTESKASRGSGTSKSKEKKVNAQVADALADLDSMFGDDA